MSSNKRIRVWKDDAQEWRWTYWASSDKVATSGESYKSRSHALHMVESLYPGIPVEVEEGDDGEA